MEVMMSLTYQQIDRIIVYLIDHDPEKKGLAAARKNLAKWLRKTPDAAALQMWDDILKKPWKEIRKYLLSQAEQMQFLRQASPFVGEACILNYIRMKIIKKSYKKP